MSIIFNSRKSQIFMFDFIFAVVLLIVAVSIILSYLGSTTENVNIYDLNLKVMESVTSTKINSLNDEEIRNFFKERKIVSVDNTIAQQISEFYYFNQNNITINNNILIDGNDSKDLSKAFIEDFIPKQININVTLEEGDGTIYEVYSLLNRPEINFEDSGVSSVTKRYILGFYKNEFYDYEIKVKLWQ